MTRAPDFNDVRHVCGLPRMGENWGDRGQVMARWRCETCGQRWRYKAEFLDHNRMWWERVGEARWTWCRSERRRLQAEWRQNNAARERT